MTIAQVRRPQAAENLPLRLELARKATLRGTVTQEAGAPDGDLAVQVLGDLALMTPKPSYGETDALIQWKAAVGADGSFELDSLPRNVPLVVRVLRGGKQLWRAPGGLLFRDDEEKVVEWMLGAKPTVIVRAVEESGAPAVGVELALERPLSRRRGGKMNRYWQSKPNSKRRLVTDAAGKVVFEGIEAGQRWITIVNAAPKSAEALADGRTAPAPTITPFAVEAGQSLIHVDVTVYRGAYIEGRLVAPDGQTIEGVAKANSSANGYGAALGTPGKDFRIGPLIPGSTTFPLAISIPRTLRQTARSRRGRAASACSCQRSKAPSCGVRSWTSWRTVRAGRR